MPELVDLILADADYLVTCDEANSVIKKGALAILNGSIFDLGPSDEIKKCYLAREVFSLEGHILMPGLTNAHVHAPMSLFRGLADDLPLNVWLSEVIFPAEAKWITKETVYLGSLLSFCEMLLSGTTCFCDGYFFEEEVARAARDIGIRGVVGQGILDFPTPDVPDSREMFKRAEGFLDTLAGFDLVKPSLFCHSPYTCSDDTILRTKELCRAGNVIFQIHLAETEWEREVILDRTGKTPVRFLHDLGVLDKKSLCIHGVWLDEEDVKILRDCRTGLVHCAESNLKLGSGIADLPLWIANGLEVGLGTDGPASNNNLDIFGEMRLVSKLHKGIKKDPEVCSPEEVLRLGTLGGAKVIGLAEEVGSLEKGKKADCVAISLGDPHTLPHLFFRFEPAEGFLPAYIVYFAKASDVKHVWVNGMLVVKDRKIVTIDETELLREVRRIARKIKET
ncbi:MAG: amidohydrolase [Thermodesulforhabdaceae bacterium]